jgi:hypothetical protein
MDVTTYEKLKEAIREAGYGYDIEWAQGVGPCESAEDFSREHAFVVCNSGMRAQVAAKIFSRVWLALCEGRAIDDSIFRNKPKSAAMQFVYENRERLFGEYLKAEDKLAYLETLPHIGGIIKYHLAKNLGEDFCKPDRHLTRIASDYKTTPEELCSRLAEATGDRIGTVDVVIWRAANLRLL